MEPHHGHPHPANTPASRIRWGGALLACGAALVLAANLLELGLPPLRSLDPAARAGQIAANAELVRQAGYTGMVGDALLGLGALFLAARDLPSRRGLQGGGWLVVALGAFVGMVVFGLFGTGYLSLASTYAANPGVFQAALRAMLAFAAIGSLGVGAGGLLVFLAEASTEHCAVRRPVSGAGLMGAAAVMLVGIAYLTGFTALLAVSYGEFLLLGAFGWLGVALARRPLRGEDVAEVAPVRANLAEPGPPVRARAASSQRRRHNG